MSKGKPVNDLVKTTQEYYDSDDADQFYHTIWGGEDIHVGIYQSPEEEIRIASNRTVRSMAELIPGLNDQTKILDLGAGYGGAARFFATQYGAHVTCLNLSEKENERNREKNEAAGLGNKVEVIQGNFESLPFGEETFDVVWSEDAILHSGNKMQVFREVDRVLNPKGSFIFTDPMQSDDCPDGVLDKILERIHLEIMGSVQLYRDHAKTLGFEEKEILEMPGQLVNHYTQVLNYLRDRKQELIQVCSRDYIERMDVGLQYWIDGGKRGYLNWGILHFVKP